MGAGYPINWADPRDAGFRLHPLYVKYNSRTFGQITLNEVQTDLANVMATADSAAVCAYLSWLIRTRQLLLAE